MNVEDFSSDTNPYREEILELMSENNQSTFPSLQEMTNMWINDEDQKMEKEEALELFYEELTDHAITCTEKEELKGFFLVKDRDEYFKERAPNHWPCLAITLAIVRQKDRRKGFSQKLLEHTQKQVAPSKDLPYITWATSSKNKASQKFVEKNNFKKAATIKNDRGKGIHTLIYAKTIE